MSTLGHLLTRQEAGQVLCLQYVSSARQRATSTSLSAFTLFAHFRDTTARLFTSSVRRPHSSSSRFGGSVFLNTWRRDLPPPGFPSSTCPSPPTGPCHRPHPPPAHHGQASPGSPRTLHLRASQSCQRLGHDLNLQLRDGIFNIGNSLSVMPLDCAMRATPPLGLHNTHLTALVATVVR